MSAAAAGPAGTVWLRNPAVSATDIDAETFLVDPESGEVFYLDEVSSALWRLLAEPQTGDAIAELFAAAFPEEPPARIARDIATALAEMDRRGLVVRRS